MSQVVRAAPRRRSVLAVTIGVLASAASVSADGVDPGVARPEQEWVQEIPFACRPHMAIPADARDPTIGWEQALSFATCVQGGLVSDGPIAVVRDPAQLDALVDELTRRLEIPMMIYLQALEEAPAPIQLRAAFHIGLAQLTLGTRARSSLVAPPDLATNSAAAARYQALHDQLEPLLVRSRRAAWVSFAAIGEAVARNPALASDVVARNMIRTAEVMLAGLGDVGQVRSQWSGQAPGAPAPGLLVGAPAPAAAGRLLDRREP